MSTRIRGLILDLDNTLVDSESAYSHALRAVGLEKDGNPYQAARLSVKNRLPAGHVSARSRFLYFKTLLEASDRYSPRTLLQLSDTYERVLSEHLAQQWSALGRATLFDGLLERFALVVVTNETTRAQVLKLAALDPDARYFRHVITSEEWGTEKPSERLLEEALTLLRSPPDACALVGDDVTTDIVPALSKGLTAVLSTEFTSSVAPSGALQIARLTDLESVLP